MKLILNYLLFCSAVIFGMVVCEYFFAPHSLYTEIKVAGDTLGNQMSMVMGRVFFYWILPVGAFTTFKNFIVSAVVKQLQRSQSNSPAQS
jgi:hypothetical protein